ncbi:hypothetical protein K4K54_005016 [Colletotrichum sp. SAR 10_86]|nr:hypothetical protein K4K54_005016 [Colletotrichum sp. SAR 10_86]KAJ5007573.1 hypothetical protein K4K48_012457 [Colletotrichum sp. SAR 10_66]
MRARVIGGLAALGVALASTCPTLTQTVYIPVVAQPTSLPPTTITIDAYTPPAGGSQYTGPKPWESGPVITSTVYIAPTPDSSIASIPGNVDGNPPATTLPGGQVTPGAPGGNGQGTTTVYTFPAGQTPPSFPWNPTDPGTNSDGVVVFSTTLYNTRPGSGGTPTVDALVTCFTVTFPSATDSGNTPGAPVGGGSVSTVVIPTMVPGPDGSLSYSLQTLLSSFPPGVGNSVPPATVVTTTYTMPAGAQDPTAGTPVIATLTLTFPQPPATGGLQPPASPGVPAQVTASPGPLGSPSVVTLWPTSQTDAAAPAGPTNAATAVGSAQPGAASTSSCTSTLTPQPTPTVVSSMEPISPSLPVPSSTETSSSLLTSTLVNVISEATTTYSFPFESLVTSISVITVSPADPGNAAGGSPPSASTSASASASASASVIVSAGGNVQSSLVLSTLVQVITTTPTATAGALERRAFLNATGPISAATPMCTGTTEVGTLSLDFDDLSVGPVYNPYHRFWFSKGFLVGPPPSDPYLPSSGGRLVEFVPPMLSNTTGFSGDTAQIGMGKTASSPCFQFDFYGMNLGCDSRIAGQLCEFTFTGYQWNATQSNETEFASQTAWVPSCPAMKECPLTVFKATGFSGLSSITVTLRVDGQPRTWWADDLLVGWSKNDCESAACRQQTGVDAVTIDNGPVWYWTSLGMRLLKPSRVSKHL